MQRRASHNKRNGRTDPRLTPTRLQVYPHRMAAQSLTPKQQAFITAYLGPANFCAQEAARIAGYATPHVDPWDGSLLDNPRVKERIQEGMRKRGMDVDECIARISDIARSNVDDVIEVDDTDGGLFRLDLKKAKRRGKLHTVESVKYGRNGPEVKMRNSLEALETLAKVHKMFGNETPGATVNVSVNLSHEDKIERLAAALDELAAAQQRTIEGEVVEAEQGE